MKSVFEKKKNEKGWVGAVGQHKYDRKKFFDSYNNIKMKGAKC